MHSARLWRAVFRYRIAFRDTSLLALATMLVIYGAFGWDWFETEGQIGLHQAEIELDEALLIGLGLGIALLVMGSRYYLRQKREIAARIAAERTARELAYQDGLTGLPNRRQFDDALRAAVDTSPRAGASHGVFLLDLNGFKQVNDMYGHAAGDAVLVTVGQRLSAAVRDGDIVARFGGDEFAILAMHLAGPEAATNIGLRIIEALEPLIWAYEVSHSIGVGIGIALVPADAVTVEEALRKADVALYRAKAERRSAFRFFEAEMDVRIHERDKVERALRSAVEQDRITVSYLPTVHLKTQEIVGFELLPKWIDPILGDVALERFVAIAEETGLIHILAEKLLRQACATACDWPNHITLSADIFPGQLKDNLLAARIIRILTETGLSANRLELEITEATLVSDMDTARLLLGSLRTAGVRIVLDNFGTGYSSLYHLRNLKIDKVKIDRSFIHAMAHERESAGIVQALVGLGHGLGFTIAAEGVDASDQETSLLGTGCEQGQGQCFSGPLTAQAIKAMFPIMKQAPVG